MRTIKQILQELLIFCLIIFSILAISCGKNVTDTLDITESKWKLKSINIDNKTCRASKEKTSRENAYILEFINDSIFNLNLSLNYANGGYKILSSGNIIIYIYQPSTEICCESTFDNQLLESFSNVTTYEVIGDHLTFKGIKGEVRFKKE